ncbi:MAG: MoaD/ThiS family protein [Treponema sp.]|nr:MoaD/ThiS family protein [Treponema sp.]
MKIIFYGNVLEYTNNEKTYEAKNCTNVRSLIDELGLHYGEGLKNFIMSDETCFFLVNGKGIMLTGGLETKLNQQDKIELIPFTEAG